jgi:hypothetical protein
VGEGKFIFTGRGREKYDERRQLHMKGGESSSKVLGISDQDKITDSWMSQRDIGPI